MVRVYHLIQTVLLIFTLVFRVSATAPAAVAQSGAVDKNGPANEVTEKPITPILSLVFPVAATTSAAEVQADAFIKISPANGASEQPITPTLSWGDSAGATGYEYCYDTSDDFNCDTGWVTSTNSVTSVVLGVLFSNTTYYWQVQAVNGITTEADSGSWYSFTTGIAPSAFYKSSPADGVTGQTITPTLSWGDSADATSYQYCCDTSGNSVCDTGWESTGISSSVELSGLSSSTTYYWQVQAINAISATEADSGNWYSFTTGLVPTAFNKLSPADGASGQPITPTLSWGSSTDATSYQYCYDTSDNNVCDTGWESTDSTSVRLSVLISSTTYYWQVQAVNAISTTEADSGSWYSFTTGLAPTAFNKLSPADGASGQPITPTLSWGSSADATGYRYCYDTSGSNSCDTGWESTGISTSVELSGLISNTTYYWQVQAINAISATEADSGSWYSFTTGLAPAAFAKSSPADGATEQLIIPTLSWGSSTDATSYEYCYDTSDNSVCDTGWESTGISTSVELSGLSSSTTYYWQVQAINGISATEADSGTWYSFTTGTAPGAFNKLSPANGVTEQPITPTLSWEGSPDAISYQYCYDTSDNGSCDTGWQSTGISSSTDLNGLSYSTTYYWQVQAVNTISTTEADGGTWFSFTTYSFIPTAPTNLSQSGATQNSVTLSWQDNSDNEGGFNIYRWDGVNIKWAYWDSIGANVTSYTVTDLQCEDVYAYKVAAYNSNGESTLSNMINATSSACVKCYLPTVMK